MLKYKSQLLAVLLSALLVSLTGCSDPFHKVYGTDSLKVYSVEEVNDTKYGKYKYHITDGTGKGWQLKTDLKFEIGDQLEIVKKAN